MQKKKTPAGLSVGQVAKRAGVSVQTLHFYETKGLIFSSRNAGNQRRYHGNQLRRIAIIKTAQRIGISLAEIAEVFNDLPRDRSPTTGEWKTMSSQWRASLQQRIDELTLLRDQLDTCIGCGCLSIKSCSLRNPDDKAAKDGSGPVFWKK
jgi:MerR family transcriptional regulator, redox-sensitive transcriptional activator SoxR